MRVASITRAAARRRHSSQIVQEEIVRQIRIGRIKQAQDEESYILSLKIYLTEDVSTIASADAKSCALIAPEYEVDQDELLLFCPRSATKSEDRVELGRLVIPELLQQDFLHHHITSLEGGHQGIGRTYQRIRAKFHRRGLYRIVQRYVGECVDCETGKGHPCDRSGSPGNVQATYPFQILGMDHIPSLPRSL